MIIIIKKCPFKSSMGVNNLYQENKKINEPKINIGGDHSMAISTIADSLNKHKNLKVIWIDAHPDINTYENSVSKNVHGMPLSYLTGLDSSEHFSFIKNKLPFDNLMYIGIRDIDEFEKDIIFKNNIKCLTVDDINNNNDQSIEKILNFINDDPVHLSFDVDGIDPSYIPCTGTDVPNGLNIDSTKNILDNINNIVNIDITELNLELGNDNDKFKLL